MNKNEIFSKEFLELDFKLISDGITKNGFFSIDKALSDNFINSVINDVESCGLSLNTNNVAGVYFTHGNQFFLTHPNFLILNPYKCLLEQFQITLFLD